MNLEWADWVSLFSHFMSLSLLAVGGAITIAPDIHRYLVDETHWLSDTQFTSSIALASGTADRSTANMFIATRPMAGHRCPRTSTSARLESSRSNPSAYPCGTMPIGIARGA